MRKIAFFAVLFVSAAVILAGGGQARAESSAETEEKEQKEPVMVLVERGDTLIKIADRHETTYPRLYDANPKIENPDLIYPGDKVRVPEQDEKLESRPLPAQVTQAVQSTTQSTAPRSYQPRTPVATQTVTGSVWDRLAACESGGNWQINTGNGYYGGLQFSLATWQGVGGSGYPHQASKAEQINRGQILQARSGWGQWPACSAQLGLR